MIKITIGNKSFDLNFPNFQNIKVSNNEVWVNGQKISGTGGGNVEVHIHGDVQGKVETDGSCTVQGNVNGGVMAGGSVRCGNVDGDVQAGGSVKGGSYGGDIMAGGSVTVNK